MPVTTWTTNTVRVALPSVCHHVRPPGILRSSNARFTPAMSNRSSIHREARMSGLDLLGNTEPEVAILDVHRGVAHLNLQDVERAGRGTGQHRARLDVELSTMARARERLLVGGKRVAAPQMRASSVVRFEHVAVFGIQPDADQSATLDPRVILRLDQIDADRYADVEERRVVGDFDPRICLWLLKCRRDERA